jgi:hypothetical protein
MHRLRQDLDRQSDLDLLDHQPVQIQVREFRECQEIKVGLMFDRVAARAINSPVLLDRTRRRFKVCQAIRVGLQPDLRVQSSRPSARDLYVTVNDYRQDVREENDLERA